MAPFMSALGIPFGSRSVYFLMSRLLRNASMRAFLSVTVVTSLPKGVWYSVVLYSCVGTLNSWSWDDLKLTIGSTGLMAQNGGFALNTSVLNKMPRDCTAPRAWAWVQRVPVDVQSSSCGWIQYTQHKMPKKNNKSATSHVFRGCREIFLVPAPRAGVNNTVFSLVSASDGSAAFAQVLCPLGLTSVKLGTSTFTAGSYGNVTGPPLRGLFNRASDFQWYRVTRAKFVFVGAVGSTATGVLTMNAYSDPYDIAIVGSAATMAGPSNRTFDLASSTNKELSIPVPVDSTWKKVSSMLTVPGNSYPFNAVDATSFATLNTIGDLSFGGVGAYLQGAPGSVTVGSFYLDYDIEFKSPIDVQLNL
ncbi:hypothetical protein 3 [Hubei tombus-like virus 3]|uniref:hypothetical protein 3 n=1 Tax=Hubei tombus-like virus 3 TaxID=1923277 RepID=UPI000909B250|nr:hypothetical protein 3 [Hubei tombus-like virus 3]APG76469.1 hypothetical protein 3 [Hubei tombus-like virus 3]